MHAEFKITVKKRRIQQVIPALQEIYPSNNLNATFVRTQFNGLTPENAFMFGYTGTNVLMLAHTTNGQLKVILENTTNPGDLIQLKNRIDQYHLEIIEGLKSRKIKVGSSVAIITLEKIEINGELPGRFKDFQQDLKKKKEKFFIEPVSALLVSFIALHYGFFDVKGFEVNVKKTLIVLSEAYVGVVFLYMVQFLFKKTGKNFIFKL